MRVKDAIALTGGGLGYPSKMPGTSYGISAHACITGSKLAKIEGSVCHGCYALKGNYQYTSVQIAHANRLASIANPAWSTAMAFLLNREHEAACREYMDLIRERAKLVKRIARKLSIPIGYQSRIADAGSGLARNTKTVMAIIQKHAVLNPAMYPLTLPRTGAIVELSQSVLSFITLVDATRALILDIWNCLQTKHTNDCTLANDATQLPDGLQLTLYNRFHDSGDLQSVEHLIKIAAVCAMTPAVKHWLPTRELKIVQDYVNAGGTIPSNLVIRVSATMVDGAATKAWPTTSGVHTVASEGLRVCPAPTQNNQCGACRACWDAKIAHVSYHKH